MKPAIRMTVCNKEWKPVRLGDIAERVTRKNKNNETDIPLTISSIYGLVDQRTYFGKTVASKDMSGYYLLKKGEFAYNKSYSVGYDYGSIKRLDDYACGALSTLYICFALKGAYNSDFFVKYFDSQKWYKAIQEICAEGARNHGLLNVPTEGFFNIQLCIPQDLEEQQKIADFLTAYDEKVSLQQQKVEALERRKKGLLQKVFSQEIRFKADDGSEFPEWEEDPLYKLGTFDKGRLLSKADIADNGIPMILYGELYTHYGEVAKDISRKTAHSIDELYITKGNEVILPCSGETPEDISTATCVIPSGVALGGDLIIIIPRKIDGRILSYIINHQLKWQIASVAQGKSVVHISASTISGIMAKYPPSSKEQQKIADFFSAIDEQIEIEKQKLEHMQTIKKGLLQQMFCDGSEEEGEAVIYDFPENRTALRAAESVTEYGRRKE